MQMPTATIPQIGRVHYLDPTGFVHQQERSLTRRLPSVAGKVAGLLDNGNDTSSYFFTSLVEALRQDYGVDKVVLRTKFTSTRPAEAGLIAEIEEEADFLIAGVAL